MIRRGASSDPLQIRFWGTRGSTCASGPRFVEFGGHTACVEVRCGQRLFVVDAGTGLAALGAELGASAPKEIDLLFSHLHMDHISGLPFFKPALLGGDRVIRTWCGHLDGDSASSSLERLYAPPLFPVRLGQLPARFEHHGFKAGDSLVFPDGARVDTHRLNHPGGATGYRFRHAGRSACYISDIEHSEPWPDAALTEFVRDADLVIYDGMFSDVEYPSCKGWGHSTWEKGVELARAANVERLAIFHLYPGHDDAFLRAAEAEMQAVMPASFFARERQTVAFPPDAERAVARKKKPAKVPTL